MLILKSVEKCLKTVRRYISACAFLGSNQNCRKYEQNTPIGSSVDTHVYHMDELSSHDFYLKNVNLRLPPATTLSFEYCDFIFFIWSLCIMRSNQICHLHFKRKK